MKKQTCSILLAALTMSFPLFASADGFMDMLFGNDAPPATRPTGRAQQPAAGQPQLSQMEQEDQEAILQFRHQPKLHLPFQIIERTWTREHERLFGEFVHRLGQGVHDKKCGTVTSCMRDPEFNIYATQDQPSMVLYSDCADFPYFLRAYFAWHNGLPFSYVSQIAVNQRPYASSNDKDDALAKASLETSPYGNVLVNRGGSNVPARGQEGMNFITYLQRMFDTVSTRTYRSGPMTPGHDLSDLYPVTLDKNGIGPGTVVSANGHAMIVWNVEKTGVIRIIDGHPGAFVQEHLLDASKLQRSRPDHGFGFFRFRPLSVVGGDFGDYGGIEGGRVVSTDDQTLYRQGLLSLDQWFGAGSNVAPGSVVSPAAWKEAFKTVGFWDYLEAQLWDENLVIGAEDAVVTSLGEICHTLQERAKSYDSNLAAGLPFVAHPEALPANIFGAEDAAWELRSSPGGDGRIKDAVRNAVRTAVAQYRKAKGGSRNIVFDGDARAFSARLRQKLADLNAGCTITYTNSNNERVNLSLNQVLSRLNLMSFDPYMCPEKSWGATGSEMASCRDMDTDGWYQAEAFIRNTVGKQDEDSNYVVRSDRPLTLDMLRDASLVDLPATSKINLGTKTPPKYMDLDAAFASEEFIRLLESNGAAAAATAATMAPATNTTTTKTTVATTTKVTAAPQPQAPVQKAPLAPTKQIGFMISDRYLRDVPGGDPIPGAGARAGTRVGVLNVTENGWVKIRLPNGFEGWVSQIAVQISDNARSTTQTSAPKQQVRPARQFGLVISDRYLRKGPEGDPVPGAVARAGTRVEILRVIDGGWAQIRLPNGRQGWISMIAIAVQIEN